MNTVPDRAAWSAALPASVAWACERFALEAPGAAYTPGGQTAWVAPTRTADGIDAVLKVAMAHYEADDEAAGLRQWDGDGAVRLIAAAKPHAHTAVLVLERCRPGSALAEQPPATQDAVLARLLPRLWRTPPFAHPFRPLSQMCDTWAEAFERRGGAERSALDPGLVRAGLALLRALSRDSGPAVLLGTDLHAGNVLAAAREPWLMIDPKPYVGDATYDVLQHMLNCLDRLGPDPGAFVAQIAADFDLDPDRLSLWLFARCVIDSDQRRELAPIAARLAPR